MKFCQDHWDRLRVAIEERGLGDLIAADGAMAAAQFKDAVEREEPTRANFDPLMSAHWAIIGNITDLLQQAARVESLFYLLGDGDEDPVAEPGYEGRTWPRCPLCYVGLAHEIACTGCSLPQVDGYAWMIDRASDDALEDARKLGLR